MRPRGTLKRGRAGGDDSGGIPCEFASFDETAMMEELDKARAIWCSDDRTAPLRHLGLFDSCTLDDLGDFGISAFAEKVREEAGRLIAMADRLTTLGVFEEPRQYAVDLMLTNLHHARTAGAHVLEAQRLGLALGGRDDVVLQTRLEDMLDEWGCKYTSIDFARARPVDRVVLFVLSCCHELRLRCLGTELYREIMVEDASGKQHGTCAWERWGDIEDFVTHACNEGTQPRRWSDLNTTNTAQVGKILTQLSDRQLPPLVTDRGLFSFRNGVYMARDDRFVPYGGEVTTVASSKYFDLDMFVPDVSHLRPEDPTRFSCISTPAFDGILDAQGFQDEERSWFYAFIGRCLYDVADRDTWQVMPYIIGVPRSGKSTVLMSVVRRFYENGDVETISSEIESKFGLSQLVHAKVLLCPEIMGDFNLPQTEFQSMVSGDVMSLAVKSKEAIRVERWKSPCFFAGNDYPKFPDVSGAISRRVVSFTFGVPIQRADETLDARLLEELPRLLVKCNRAYLVKILEADGDVWGSLPESIQNSRKALAAAGNPLNAMLLDERIICPDPDGAMPLSHVRKRLMEREKRLGGDIKFISQMSDESMRGCIVSHGFSYVNDTRPWQGGTLSGGYSNDNHFEFYPPGTTVFDANVVRATLKRINEGVARIYFTDGNNNTLGVPKAATLMENAGIGEDGNGRLMPVAAYRNEFIITYIGAYVMRWNGVIWFSLDPKREQAVRGHLPSGEVKEGVGIGLLNLHGELGFR